ncbi:Ig-like domain-containing protein [Cohnella endophytica]|nr:Ig-like domain-containing protein [Cohnella endophytica]
MVYEIVAQGDGKSLKAGPFTLLAGTDTEGPTFSNPSPANSDEIETKHPVISVSMFDLSGVNISTAKIKLDGTDVTNKATITDNQIKLTLTTDLTEGVHTVAVEADDSLGNHSLPYSWQFKVAKRFVGGNHYRGTTHNHTNISHDAQGTPEKALTEAMKYDYDYFAFSDHSHDIDACPIDPNTKKAVCSDTKDHNGMPERTGGIDWKTTKDLAALYNQKNPGKFVVFPAFEMTSTTWGHSNVFGTDNFIDRMQNDGTYQNLQNYYAWTMTYDNIVAQFNHPNAPDPSFNNFIPYNKTLDKLFTLLEVGNGSGQYSYSNTQNKYFTALDIGWHVAPTYGEDNHDATWGQTKKRTVIVADDLTQESLLDSMRNMHVYMSEDPNAKMDVMASGWYMGSITDTKTLKFDINVSDPVLENRNDPKYNYLLPSITQNDNISKIELVTNGGRVIDSIDLSSQNVTTYNWKPDEITVSGGQQWFVVRVTQKDNDKLFSAPIWTPTDPLNVKVTSVVAEGGAITGGVPVKLTAGISNMGVVNVGNLKASFYMDDPTLGNKIGEVMIDSLQKNKSTTAEVIWSEPIEGPHDITVVLTAGDGNDLGTNKFKQSFTIKPSLGIKIVIDASHKNENSSKDTGTYVNNLQTLTTLLRKEGYTVVENTGADITAATLAGAKILVITHPASTYSTTETTAVKDFVTSGGSIYLSENSNNQALNSLLSGIGSKILFNKDVVYDDTAYGNFYNPPLANEYKVKAHPVPLDNYLTDFVSGLDFYSGTSLARNNGADVKEALVENSDISILVRGNESSFQQSAPAGVFNYKVGSGASGGSKIPLVAAEKINDGRLIVAGMNLFNDIQLKGTNDNTQFALNTISWLAHREPKVISIGEARTKAVDTAVVVQGKVTSAAGGFYDAAYVQDDTGGIMAFNEVPPGSLKLGDTIRIYGHIQVFEDNFELIFDKFANSIVKLSSGSPVQPKSVSTAASVSAANMGQLVKVFGTVVGIPDSSSFIINDGSGPVTVFVDGYIASQSGIPVPELAIGDKIAVIGISGGYSGGTRIRVRDTSELKKTNALVPVTGITISSDSKVMTLGDPSFTLTASVQPSNATYSSFAWTSSNESVAKVTNGVVTPVGLGTAIISADSTDGGMKASATINVIPTAPNVRADISNSTIVSNDSAIPLASMPTMEYNIDNTSWITFVPASPPTFSGEHNVQIRFKAYADVLEGQIKNLYFNTPASDLSGFTLAVGDTLGTKLTTVAAGNLKYAVGQLNSRYRPASGELATDYSKQLLANQDIYVTAGQHIYIVSVDGNNKIIGWTDLTADGAKIKVPAIVAKWDFEAKNEFASGGSPANKGIKTVTLTGAIPANPAYSGGASGSAVGAIAGTSWIPVPSYWEATFDTTDYSYIEVSSKMYGSASGPRDFKLQYSLNGTTWFDVPNASIVVANATWTNSGVLNNASLPASANNQSNVHVRWLNTSTASTGGGNFSSAGTNRLDDVVINGIPLSPAPNVSADDVSKVITGINSTMEYNINNAGWVSYNPGGAPNLNGNFSVQVRVKAKGDVLPGAIKLLTFTQGDIRVTEVTLNTSAFNLAVGGSSYTLLSNVAPTDATDKTVTWNSDKPAIATVNANGVVTAVAPGTATITVKTVDGNFTASATVTVSATPVSVTGVSLSATNFNMTVGDDDYQLTESVKPAGATNQTVTWSTSDSNIATVNNGKVTAVAPGTATITVKTADGNFTASATVTVSAVIVPVTGVSLNASAFNLTVGGTDYGLLPIFTPTNATDKTVTWSSDKPGIATVNTNGVVTAVTPGTATITVKTADGNFTASATVTVSAVIVPVTGVSLNASSFNLTVGGTDYGLLPIFTPANATDKTVTWSSDMPGIAAVSVNGVVTAVAPGTATITVKTADGNFTASATVTVSAVIVPVTGVSLNTSTINLAVGGAEYELSPIFTPSNATDKTVTWSSDKPGIATVNTNGVVTAVTPGTATITVKTADGDFTASATVNVSAVPVSVTGVTLSVSDFNMTVGDDDYQLTESVKPDEATNQTVTWLTSDATIASVVNGKVTAVGAGTATITVKTAEGSFTASATVHVVAPIVRVTGVSLNNSAVNLTVGGVNYGLLPIFTPANATDKSVTWSSDKPDIASINSNGIVTAVSAGTAIITVTTVDGQKTATSTITVTNSNPGDGNPGPTPKPTPDPEPTPEPTPGTVNVSAEKLVADGKGKATVDVPAGTKEVKLAVTVADQLKGNTLEIKSDKLSLNIPSDLIKQLESKLSASEQKDSTISLKFEPLATTEANALIGKGADASNNAIKAVGEVYEFSLTITTADGKTEKLTQFTQLITIRLKVDPSVNPKLTGIFYISDDGKLEYIGGEYSNGEMVAQINHFSKYALLEVKKNFVDLPAKYWAYNVVQELAMKQLVNGTSATAFEPERAITRAEFTAMLVKALGLTKSGTSKFTDVAAGKWYAEAISIAYNAGIVKGKSETTFEPNGKITREEMVTMMMQAYKLLDGKTPTGASVTFTDEAQISSWAVAYVKEAAALKLINGRSAGMFVPKGVSTRAEAAQVIYSLLQR